RRVKDSQAGAVAAGLRHGVAGDGNEIQGRLSIPQQHRAAVGVQTGRAIAGKQTIAQLQVDGLVVQSAAARRRIVVDENQVVQIKILVADNGARLSVAKFQPANDDVEQVVRRIVDNKDAPRV